mgnify:CR=1 FL=1
MSKIAKGVERKRGRGRPPLSPGQAKRSSFNTRIRPEIKKLLEREARKAGRSLSEEIEYRLEGSLQNEQERYEEFGGRNGYELCRLFAVMGNQVSRTTGKSWVEDLNTFTATRGLWGKFTNEIFNGKIKPIVIKSWIKDGNDLAESEFNKLLELSFPNTWSSDQKE